MADPEIEAMGKVADALGDLEKDVRSRVLRWASERYGIDGLSRQRTTVEKDKEDESETNDAGNGGRDGTGGGSGAERQFEHFAELYDAVGPSTDQERVLVAGYWTQVSLGKSPFGSQELNRVLKDLGHGSKAVNKAMSSNIGRKPALILQVSRGGSSQQARKRYKLTDAGLKWVNGRLS